MITPRRAKQKSPPAEKVTGTQSIQRAIDILHEIASCADTEGLRLSDLCTRTGLERPTAYRILTCLEENQMLVRAPQSRSYQLGPSIFHLGLAATQHHSLSDTCAFALDSLAAETGNTVFLTVRNGNDSVTVDRRVGTFPIQALSLNVGARRPLGIGAGSLAILAALPDAEARTLITENAARFGPYTDLDSKGLNALVSQGRSDGYVLNVGHVTAEVTALGMPIRNSFGAPIGAITVAAIRSRMTAEHIATCVQLMSEQIRQLEKIISGQAAKGNNARRADGS
jgi:DNA-binding IclR family transcriptional regulator